MTVQITHDELTRELAGTQCGECGYGGCAPYADALLKADAPTNLCRPGGEAIAQRIAELLEKEYQAPAKAVEPALTAWVDPALCIGCTLCRQACPTDAIIGSAKMQHTVIASDCTGCRLCIEPCPVDCIEIQPNSATPPEDKAAVWALVDRADLRRSRQKPSTSVPKVELSAEQQEKIAAARAKIRAKYTQQNQ